MTEPRPDRTPLTDEQLAARTVGERLKLNAPIVLEPYDPQWPRLYEGQAAKIRAALGERVRGLEHVGSTSVPGLMAKPIIDMQLLVPDSADEGAYVPDLEAAGFVLRTREPDWFEHRMFRSLWPPVHLHVYSDGCVEARRVVAFRDRLRTDDADRRLYQETKQTLAGRVWNDMQNYADAKTEVVLAILGRALAP
jgi:GrpB-like predicted nucleotidyltransferase (UPF0157 family)